MRMKLDILREESAQAMVEFALVIPFLLLLLFALIQVLLIAQAAQLGNYAAYAAARTYAVRSGVSGLDGDAEDYAKKAAALVYAPVSRLVPNEVAALPGGLAGLIPGGLPDFVDKAAEITEGFLVAYYVRLSLLGGGDFKVSRSGSPEQVQVELEFAYPIFLPGLAEAWSLVAGERNMKTQLKDWNVADDTLLGMLSSPYSYVIIKSKCAMGYEPWSGTPRERKTVSSDAATDPSLAEHVEDIEEAKVALETALEEEDAAYNVWQQKKAELDAAQAAYDANPTAANLAALNAAKAAEEAAHNDYLAKKAIREQRQDEYENLIGL